VRSAVSAPRRTRTYNPLIKSRMGIIPNSIASNELRNTSMELAASLPCADPELDIVCRAWPSLPQSVRDAIIDTIHEHRRLEN